MGCCSSSELTAADDVLINRFVQVAREGNDDQGENSATWTKYQRSEDGPRGSRLSSRKGPEGMYWRGEAVYRAQLSIVAWFLRNQTEFNAISEIDKDVLSPEMYSIFQRNRSKVVKMDACHSTMKVTLQMPSPVVPREFHVKELNTTLPDKSHVIICRSKVKSGSNSTATATDTFATSNSQTVSSSQENHGSVRPKSGALAAFTGTPNSPSTSRPKSGVLAAFQNTAASRSGRGKIVVAGYLLEPVQDNKYTKVTYLSCVDPCLTDSECEGLLLAESFNDLQPEKKLSGSDKVVQDVLGMSRILAHVESPRRYFEDPKSLWVEQLFRLASANVGEFGFTKMEKQQHGASRLQTGTHVKSNGQHGVIKYFDIHGNAFVRYDNGLEVEYSKDNLHELNAVVEIGTRVVHTTRGPGTVKRFDDNDERIHIKFDNGEYHRYAQKSWTEKIKIVGQSNYNNVMLARCRQINLEGITDPKSLHMNAGVKAPPVQKRRRTLSLRKKKKPEPPKDFNAECLRISFAVGASVQEVLKHVKNFKEGSKAGVEEHTVLQEHSKNHKTEYQRVKMPGTTNPRDYVYDTFWKEVDESTYVVVSKSTESEKKPCVPGCIRANIVIRGYLIEPLYDVKTVVSNDKLCTRVTFLTCLEPGGFLSPTQIFTETRTELIGVLTDMRSFFYNKTTVNRTSKRASGGFRNKDKRRDLRRRSTLDLNNTNSSSSAE